MSLERWANNGWLRLHETSLQEIGGLLAIVERDLADSVSNISADWRFGIAYNAALKLCTVLLYASGYRAESTLQHYRTIIALPLILGESRKDDADYLDTCRKKRNQAEYEQAGVATEQDADELVSFVREFIVDVCDWLQQHHPGLVPPDPT